MRYLAIDPGDKRVGLAVGDDQTYIVTPVAVIQRAQGDRFIDQVRAAVQEHEPDQIVLGLPLNMDGSEGPAAKASRSLAGKLADSLKIKIHLFDERLTSDRADQLLQPQALTRKQRASRHDALAAASILTSFLERH